MRAFLAVVAGYLIFAGSAVVFFRLLNVDPHSPATARFEVLTIAYGLGFALLGGFVTGKIARRPDSNCGIALALVIALGATVSMVAQPGAGALWTQTAALLVCAPASPAGYWVRKRTRRRTPVTTLHPFHADIQSSQEPASFFHSRCFIGDKSPCHSQPPAPALRLVDRRLP